MEIPIQKFGKNIIYENEVLSHNIKKYVLTFQKNLPTTITDSIRGISINQKIYDDLSGMNTYMTLRLDKRVDYYHSKIELYEIFQKATKLSGVAISLLKEEEPISSNSWTKYFYKFDLGYYKFVN